MPTQNQWDCPLRKVVKLWDLGTSERLLLISTIHHVGSTGEDRGSGKHTLATSSQGNSLYMFLENKLVIFILLSLPLPPFTILPNVV
jgi:hypothetical protein